MTPEGPTRQKIAQQYRQFQLRAYSAGGDEFILFFENPEAVSEEFLQQIVTWYQEEIQTSPYMKAHVDFDNVENLMNYVDMDADMRAEIRKLAPEQRMQHEVIAKIRLNLPRTFVPHFSGGHAYISDAMKEAMHHMQDGKIDTVHAAWEHMKQVTAALVKCADMRQREDKHRYKEKLRQSDPQQYDFMLRTKEEESLEKELRAARAANVKLMRILLEQGLTQERIAELMARTT